MRTCCDFTDVQPSYDVVVVGAGAGGLATSTVAAEKGLRVLLVEKTGFVGGTTAISGGMLWIPCSHKALEKSEIQDSRRNARTYLDNVVVGKQNSELRDTYLAKGPEAVRYLEGHSAIRLQPVPTYPDYYPEQEGAMAGGRVLEPVPFDARHLGRAFKKLRRPMPEFMLFGGMMVSRADIPHFRNMFKSPASLWRVVKLVTQYLFQRLGSSRGTTLYLGNALVGHFFAAALAAGVDISLDTQVEELKGADGRVTGAQLRSGNATCTVRASHGVVLAGGGFSNDSTLRRHCLPAEINFRTPVREGATGDGIRLAQMRGGVLGEGVEGNAFWVPASFGTRLDGSDLVYPHTVTDRSKPGLIAVDPSGRRFVNEAVSYHEFVRRVLIRHEQSPCIPAHLICDADFIWKYGLGGIKPFSVSLKHYVKSGYLYRAHTLAELGRQLGINADELVNTVEKYNKDAWQGRDPEFGRGENVYQTRLGDANHPVSPCNAPIVKKPFYAVTIYPTDLGTAAGLVTDERARVLNETGTPIGGLYACGNDMRSIMNGSYPGAGITLGPAVVFGYIAALELASQNDGALAEANEGQTCKAS